jgi:hypothetical protein
MNEIFVDIDGFDGYKISNYGNVMSYLINKNGSLLKFRYRGNKRKLYRYVVLYKKQVRHNLSIHKLVAMMFLTDYDETKQVDHIDGDQMNNCVSNLRMCSNSQNQMNSKKKVVNNRGIKVSSHYKGVSRHKNGSWVSNITINRYQTYLGSFATELEAYQARVEYIHNNVAPENRFFYKL